MRQSTGSRRKPTKGTKSKKVPNRPRARAKTVTGSGSVRKKPI